MVYLRFRDVALGMDNAVKINRKNTRPSRGLIILHGIPRESTNLISGTSPVCILSDIQCAHFRARHAVCGPSERTLEALFYSDGTPDSVRLSCVQFFKKFTYTESSELVYGIFRLLSMPRPAHLRMDQSAVRPLAHLRNVRARCGRKRVL